ncbi:potassium channel family protein [Streptomyces spororaveus]|nr:potassium channel family protein [Streptomyces spororaveus]
MCTDLLAAHAAGVHLHLHRRALLPAEHSSFTDALYISLVNISTLGLGDIAPTEGWLRILAPLEAFVGFALLTATVSWTLGIYPAPASRRAPALRLSHLSRTHLTAEQIDTDAPDVMLSAAVLRTALEDLAVILDQRFLHTQGRL